MKIKITFFCLLLCKLNILYSQNVLISGENINNINKVELINNLPFRWSDINGDFKILFDKRGDTFSLPLQIDHITVKQIMPPGYSFAQTIFITRGDSVTFSVKSNGDNNFYYHFEGKNASHYNYDGLINKIFPYKEIPKYKKDTSFEIYKDSLASFYKRKQIFLDKYIKTHEVSNDFTNYARSCIVNDYAFNLFQTIVSNPNIISADEANDIFENTPIETNSLPVTYGAAIRYKYINRYESNKDINLIYQNILTYTEGEIQDYLISALIGTYAIRQKQSERESLLKIIHENTSHIKRGEFAEYIQNALNYTMIINQPIPKDILSTTYVRSFQDEKKVNLTKVLEKYNGKAIYIDFWASWCTPCRLHINNSLSARKYLEEKNIVYLYLSIDENEKAWLKASEKDKTTDNQYLIDNNTSSPLAKYFNIIYIPRYILLDSSHQIKNNKTPAPNEENLDQLKEAISTMITKVYRF
ncbi:MAG TPA: TlpA disulfide reductase family protein [Dysgonomonas sp.]|uniref:TlpA family protein disulfide reductase n=1 Tax=unclassified Dysgonomonas TaxID=2630389 RepID=UPI0025BE749D|nr:MULTISPECIES: TlpA disulfide reductase family protein [unclassified Dysgonomonas]HML66235.1 TlpA disulfide reductase family protein [Dysgonomonas sp.]